MAPGSLIGWEYRHDDPGPGNDCRKNCHKLGRAGWELVTVLVDGVYVYKRPLIPK